MIINKKLNCGVRIVMEEIPYVQSVSIGIWVKAGSVDETAKNSGISHFIEHMVFKGTHTRSAAEIASQTDAIGGQINAFTTKECTCFYGRVLDIHLPQLSDILCDMFFHPRFDDADVQSERGVIMEEIDMYEDAPEDLVSERLITAIYRGSSLSRPILGRKASLDAVTGASLREYMDSHYSPDRIVIAISGSFSPSDLEFFRDRFSAIPVLRKRRIPSVSCSPAVISKKKPVEQNHLCIGFPGLSVSDDRRFALQLLSGILGGSVSSRLFQTVREKHGLCYSIYTFGASYIDTGIFGIYTALGRESEDGALRMIFDEIRRFKEDGITDEELICAREQAKANVLMSLESTSARMNRLGKNELFLGHIADPDEIIALYDAVTKDDIRALGECCLDIGSLSFSAVGRVKNAEDYRQTIDNMIAG